MSMERLWTYFLNIFTVLGLGYAGIRYIVKQIMQQLEYSMDKKFDKVNLKLAELELSTNKSFKELKEENKNLNLHNIKDTLEYALKDYTNFIIDNKKINKDLDVFIEKRYKIYTDLGGNGEIKYLYDNYIKIRNEVVPCVIC